MMTVGLPPIPSIGTNVDVSSVAATMVEKDLMRSGPASLYPTGATPLVAPPAVSTNAQLDASLPAAASDLQARPALAPGFAASSAPQSAHGLPPSMNPGLSAVVPSAFHPQVQPMRTDIATNAHVSNPTGPLQSIPVTTISTNAYLSEALTSRPDQDRPVSKPAEDTVPRDPGRLNSAPLPPSSSGNDRDLRSVTGREEREGPEHNRADPYYRHDREREHYRSEDHRERRSWREEPQHSNRDYYEHERPRLYQDGRPEDRSHYGYEYQGQGSHRSTSQGGAYYDDRLRSRQAPSDYSYDERSEWGEKQRGYGRYPYDRHQADPYYDGQRYYPESQRGDPRFDSYYDRHAHYDDARTYRDASHYRAPEYTHEREQKDPYFDDRYSRDPYYGRDHPHYSQREAERTLPSQEHSFSPEMSVIPGRQELEVTQFESPSIHPARPPYRTYDDQPEHYPPTAGREEVDYRGDDPYRYDDYYRDGGYGEYDQTYEGYGPGGRDDRWVPISDPAAIEEPPPPPPTPKLFDHPHVRVSFSFSGQLVTVLPCNPRAHQLATIELAPIGQLIRDAETDAFSDEVLSSPGPLIPYDTPKSHVVHFAACEAEKCREKSRVAAEESDSRVARSLEDEALLWELLALLCRQNGMVVAADVVELLLRHTDVPPRPSTHFKAPEDQAEALDRFRDLLLYGRKKEALELACRETLWGHALMLANHLDDQSRTYVVNRFTASLTTTDPLGTLYTLLLGRLPSVAKPDGLSRAGDWRSHLAMMLSNRAAKLDDSSIAALGDSLLLQGRLHAAHVCFYLSGEDYGSRGSIDSKFVLLGVDHSRFRPGVCPDPRELWKTEVFEYAMALGQRDVSLPGFQLFKYFYLLKLLELGRVEKAFKCCEQMAYFVSHGGNGSARGYLPTFLLSLVELSVKLHHTNHPRGVVETELPTWLLQLHQSVTEVLSSEQIRSSVSPAFSSVSQTFGVQQQNALSAMPSTHLMVPGSHIGSSQDVSETADSSRGESPADFQLAVPKVEGGVHQLEAYSQAGTYPTDPEQYGTGYVMNPSTQEQYVTNPSAQEQYGAGYITNPSTEQQYGAASTGYVANPSTQEQYGAASTGYVTNPLTQEPSYGVSAPVPPRDSAPDDQVGSSLSVGYTQSSTDINAPLSSQPQAQDGYAVADRTGEIPPFPVAGETGSSQQLGDVGSGALNPAYATGYPSSRSDFEFQRQTGAPRTGPYDPRQSQSQSGGGASFQYGVGMGQGGGVQESLDDQAAGEYGRGGGDLEGKHVAEETKKTFKPVKGYLCILHMYMYLHTW